MPAHSFNRPFSLALVGATALGVSLDLHTAEARGTIEPTVQQHKWHLFEQIGAGAFGIVRLGMHEESGEVAAVKIVPLENPSDRSQSVLEREISALQLIKALGGHQNIIDLRDVYVEGRNVCLVTELARGGELFEQIVSYGSFPEPIAQSLARDLANALSFLHRHGLVHKDIKPENILLKTRQMNHESSGVFRNGNASPSVKLADFGSAGPAGEASNFDELGTAAYLPPEVLISGVCTKAWDMWALGCVLYIMLSGSHPFDLDGLAPDHVVEQRIKSEPITFAFSAWDNVSPDAKDLISKLLVKDSELRLTAEQMLQHPWIKSNTEANTGEELRRGSLPLVAGQPIPMWTS